MTAKGRRAALAAGGALWLALALILVGCAASGASTTSSGTVALAQISWCDQPSISFQDDGQVTRPILTDWNQVKSRLGFTPYLPATLPKGTCLALAGGSVHDPIFGGRFLITSYLPATGPLSFSEAPKQTGQAGQATSKVQCTQSAQATTTANATPSPGTTPTLPLTVCLGTIGNTNISMASAMASNNLQNLFGSLKPNIEWVPPQPATPTPSPTPKG